MIDESFSAGDSFIHRLHPQTRLAGVVIYSVLVAVCQQFSTLGAALAVSLVLTALAKLNTKRVLRRIIPANKLILFLWIVLPFSADQWLSGLSLAALITLKTNAVLLALTALAATCPIAAIGQSLSRWSTPDKLVYLLLLNYRYLFIMGEECQKLITAARLRGFQPGFNFHTCRAYAYLVGMLLARSSIRGERVCHAMICRGFTGRFYCLIEFQFSAEDFIFWGAAPVIIGGIVVLEWEKIILSLI